MANIRRYASPVIEDDSLTPEPSFYRSREMSFVSITCVQEAAVSTIRAIGKFSNLHIIDIATKVSEDEKVDADAVNKRLMELKKDIGDVVSAERRLAMLADVMTKYKVQIPDIATDFAKVEVESTQLRHIEAQLDEAEARLQKDTAVVTEMKRELNTLKEQIVVLQKTKNFAKEAYEMGGLLGHERRGSQAGGEYESKSLLGGDDDFADPEMGGHAAGGLGIQMKDKVLTGVLGLEQQGMFERMVFRISRGNVFIRFLNITEPLIDQMTGELQMKIVFYVVYVGRDQIRGKIQRLLHSMNASTFTLPDSPDLFDSEIATLTMLRGEKETVIARTEENIRRDLETLAVASDDRAQDRDSERDGGAGSDGEESKEAVNTALLSSSSSTSSSSSLPSSSQSHGAASGLYSPIREMQYRLLEHKSISEVLMKSRWTGSSLEIAGWAPTELVERGEQSTLYQYLTQAAINDMLPAISVHKYDLARLSELMSHGTSLSSLAEADRPPPTAFEYNKFTRVFQTIVDTYGVPRYQEVNPGLFTMMTFPWLFGIMYGDVGHGSILALAALFAILNEKRLDEMQKNKSMNEMVSMVYTGRYIIFLMGLFAIYSGALYNDCLSIPMGASVWTKSSKGEFSNPAGTVPWFGVDPAWHHKKNELAFLNSLKMKQSVILGVIHMLCGIFMSVLNHLHFNDHVSIYCEFIPRLLFMSCTFGYMIILIIIKWCTDWTGKTSLAPNIIQIMINMFLSGGALPKGSQSLYAGQESVQAALLVIALLCVPIMLIGKPLMQYNDMQAKKKSRELHGLGGDAILELNTPVSPSSAAGASSSSGSFASFSSSSSSSSSVSLSASSSDDGTGAGKKDPAGHGHDDEVEVHFSDLMIHQGIHTIEFVLGAVSNTASYLRLWALSLAHAELAEVFWTKMINEYGYKSGSLMLVVGFAIWTGATFGVLLCMDALECFLHALRLHWVEFQNKFFNGDGYAFKPFTFQDHEGMLIKSAGAEEKEKNV